MHLSVWCVLGKQRAAGSWTGDAGEGEDGVSRLVVCLVVVERHGEEVRQGF